MNDPARNVEAELRHRLTAAVDAVVDPTRLRPAPALRAHRSRAPFLLVAAAVTATVVVVGVTSLVRPGLVVEPSGPDVVSGPALVLEPTEIRVDGLVLTVPDGLNARQVPTDLATAGYEFCLLPQNQPAVVGELSDCLGANGIRVRVASSPVRDAPIVPLTGGFVDGCPGTIIPILSDPVALPDPGERTQRAFGLHCASSLADDTVPPDSVSWELLDQSLDVQTPFTGEWQEQAQVLLDQLDLSGWRHGPGVVTVESTVVQASSVPPADQPVPTELQVGFPRNAKGMTYGSQLDGEPDLISVYATNGVVGFVLRADMMGYQPTSPEDAQRWQETRPASWPIPVWDAEYEEIVGEFVIGG